MTSDELRERYLSFFEERGHQRLASGSLVPASYDPSVLLTTAGMHPLKPYFLGIEKPPRDRLTSCQKCFRTPDIESVGSTTRHLTFFEMLGNFSIGDYFKHGAAEFAWEFSTQALGFDPEKIWATAFEGDPQLGLGPDEEAIEAFMAIGIPRERIVLLPRKENFWQAGPIGPCGPCGELYLDRGLDFGAEDDLPGGDNERFLEYWNLVFMQFNQDPENVLTPLPTQNIDTGMGLNRVAMLLQDKQTIFETDQFEPLIRLGEELSGRTYGESAEVDRALRILADHTRGMSFLVADGVVPSNEDRGYVLRRVMRRAVREGRRIGIEEPKSLVRFSRLVRELMGSAYPELTEQADTIDMWLSREEEAFGRTIEQGMRLLEEHIERARAQGLEGIGGDAAFELHDTYGFPIDLTLEISAERGVGVDHAGFETLMDEQRARSKRVGGAAAGKDVVREAAQRLAGSTSFVGYETLESLTSVSALEEMDGRLLVKLEQSPFYATGGGQVADAGHVECESGDCRARVVDVVRVGDEQAVLLEAEQGELKPGERVRALVDPAHRRPTEANHTATHLLHAALRQHVGSHVRQAGSYVGPDKLRFDFTHGQPLTEDEVRAVEDTVNEWILANRPVQATTTSLDEAKSRGAMALFGEKYGDTVRMVEVGDGNWSRELCGGTHVRTTAEIGAFKITQETSSAANVRRIEAITGPAAIDTLRRHDRVLAQAAAALRGRPEEVAERVAELQRQLKEARKGAEQSKQVDPGTLVSEASDVDGLRVLVAQSPVAEPKAMMELVDKLKGKLGENAVVVLGAGAEGRVHLVAGATPAAVQRGIKAGAIVKTAAQVVGGGGGGKDTMAQAGGRDPEKLPDALEAARAEVEKLLAG